ncbi:hypothetical protein H9Q73_014404, partial [Fusarium xylarioides]
NQIKIVYAVTGLYNFLAFEGSEPELGHEEEGLPDWEIRALARARSRADEVVTGRSGTNMRSLIQVGFGLLIKRIYGFLMTPDLRKQMKKGALWWMKKGALQADEADEREAISSSQELD